jgi:hypothetical protein
VQVQRGHQNMKAFVQIHTDGEFYNENYFNAWRAFEWMGYKTVRFKQFQSPDDITKETPVFASVQQTKMIFNQLGIKHDELVSYPRCLDKYLYRNVGIAPIHEIRQGVCKGESIFVKPLDKNRKKFDGHLLKTEKDLIYLGGLEDDLQVYISEPINFKSEYRAFILHNEILDVRKYQGDFELVPSRNVINNMIRSLQGHDLAPKAYCLDLGVCVNKNGHDYTALVEVTDAWAFGHYGLPFQDYGKMIIERWNEICSLNQ